MRLNARRYSTGFNGKLKYTLAVCASRWSVRQCLPVIFKPHCLLKFHFRSKSSKLSILVRWVLSHERKRFAKFSKAPRYRLISLDLHICSYEINDIGSRRFLVAAAQFGNSSCLLPKQNLFSKKSSSLRAPATLHRCEVQQKAEYGAEFWCNITLDIKKIRAVISKCGICSTRLKLYSKLQRSFQP